MLHGVIAVTASAMCSSMETQGDLFLLFYTVIEVFYSCVIVL